MNDADIIKGLSQITYAGHGCKKCNYGIKKGEDRCGLKGCKIAKEALDLICRQQVKIEELEETHWNECMQIAQYDDDNKSEAVRNFAENLKSKLSKQSKMSLYEKK